MDKRQLKTRAKLSEAILSLTAMKPVHEITVSEIAQRAEINRSTFYQHATGAADLLRNTLRAELDQIRDEYLFAANTSYDSAVAGVTLAVLEHVDTHAEIYKRGLGNESASGSLHYLLVSHFVESIRILYGQHSISEYIPAGADPKFVEDMSAHYVAYGTVGALHGWLHSEEPRSKSSFLKIFDSLTPQWWPTTSHQ